MIRYSLRCSEGHDFESWFRNSSAFDALSAAGQVSCSVCGSAKVEKTLMAPAVSGTREKSEEPAPLSTPTTPAEAALRKMREHLRKNSDYVGQEFAQEARRIHDGEADERAIWGEATLDDAKSLNDDGIPVAPIPWMSRQDD